MMKKIAVLTSGGDAPGMNAAVRSVVLKANALGLEVVGVKYGFQGLINKDFITIDANSMANALQTGGTFLYTRRFTEFKEVEIQKQAITNMQEAEIDALVVIGGDGSYRGALALSELGFPTIGIPATIDNDIAGTNYTIGFDTALKTAVQAVDQIRDTATSHERIFIIEVMGRHSGNIAFWTGITTGVEQIVIPEIEVTFEHIVGKIRDQRAKGHKRFLIVLSEGVMSAHDFTVGLHNVDDRLQIRQTELGHVQRGGSPTPKDRALAVRFGSKAVEELVAGTSGVCVATEGDVILVKPMTEAFKEDDYLQKVLDDETLRHLLV